MNATSARRWRTIDHLALAAAGAALLAACGDGGAKPDDGRPGVAPPPAACEGAEVFDGTFAALQDTVFARHGCTETICHGGREGVLDLSPDVAYRNLLEKPSTTGMPYVTPGDRTRSYLYRKLAAKTEPGSFEIEGAPMPNGLPAISAGELEALRLWIYAGAPETGTVGGTESLLDACLPPPRPLSIDPLPPPDPETGFQLVMPPWPLPRQSEHELCFATYYDVTSVVPERFRRADRFRLRGFELRQDPQSHHLTLYYPTGNYRPGGIDTSDPSFGAWTCVGGETSGAACEPQHTASCGSGFCRSEPRPTFGCNGYGPRGNPILPIGGAQQAQGHAFFPDGVYAELPMRGVVYWNTHAFNTFDADHQMNGRLNYLYAEAQTHFARSIFDIDDIFAADAAPYTEQMVCSDHVLPEGARLFELSSHTHKRGKRFTVALPDGSLVYESTRYNDPERREFATPLAFDADDDADRTLRYCALYNNGRAADGTPDPETVTRASRIPESARLTTGGCTPVACAAGRIGAPCDGEGDDATCDSSPGAGDGDCDACRITGGESTENEMFILIGTYYVDHAGGAPAGGPPGEAGDESLAALAGLGHFGCASGGAASHGTRDGHVAAHGAHSSP